jgi:hypothetical protein
MTQKRAASDDKHEPRIRHCGVLQRLDITIVFFVKTNEKQFAEGFNY